MGSTGCFIVTTGHIYLSRRAAHIHEMLSCTVNFILTIIYDVYDSRIPYIKKRVSIRCYVSRNFNVYSFRCVNLNWPGICSRTNFIIAAFCNRLAAM